MRGADDLWDEYRKGPPLVSNPARMSPEQIARKLGAAQRRVVLALFDEWAESGNQAAAKRLWYRNDIPQLLDHRHRTNDCWQLRPIGIAVQAVLRRQCQ